MEVRLRSAAVVITAQQLNPTVFSQPWLIKHLGLSLEDFQPGAAYTPIFSNSPTRRFHLLVLQDRLQFMPMPDQPDEAELVRATVSTIVTMLSHTPYTAAGMNFEWGLHTDGQSNGVTTRRLFFTEQHWLCRQFAGQDACFGTYVSKNVLGCRLRLEVRPITQTVEGNPEDIVHFGFNYNLDLTGEDRVGPIQTMLAQWNAAKIDSRTIVDAGLEALR